MSKVSEAAMEELEDVARLTGEDEWDVKQEWKEASEKGIGWNEFIAQKAKK